jgi:hypothetical protein
MKIHNDNINKGKHMLLTPEQMNAANKANIEILNNLSKHAFEGIEKLLELNMQVVRKSGTRTNDEFKIQCLRLKMFNPF